MQRVIVRRCLLCAGAGKNLLGAVCPNCEGEGEIFEGDADLKARVIRDRTPLELRADKKARRRRKQPWRNTSDPIEEDL